MSVAFVDNASATFFPVGSCGGGSSGSSGSSSPCYTYNEGVQPTTSRSTSFANMEPARHAPRWGRRVSRRGKGSLLTHLLIFFLFLTSLMVLLQVWLMLPPGLNAAAPRQPGRGFLPPAGSRKWPAAAAAAAAAAAVAVGATAGAAAAAGKGTTAGTEGEEEEEEEEEEKGKQAAIPSKCSARDSYGLPVNTRAWWGDEWIRWKNVVWEKRRRQSGMRSES